MERFADPTPEQQAAWQLYNEALGHLANVYGVSPDELNELAGSSVEQAISQLSHEDAA